jgi:hypothetical protein
MSPADRAAGAGQLSEERLVEAVASRILEFLQPVLEALADRAPSGALVDASTLAQQLGVSRQFVYEHAEELGVLRLGARCRPTLRFDLEAAQRIRQRTADDRSQPLVRPRPTAERRPRLSAPRLLPVRNGRVR